MTRHMLSAALWAALSATAAGAQSAFTAGAGAFIESYRFGDAASVGFKSVTLLTVPIAAEARLGSFARLGASTFFASGGAVRSDDTDYSISGLTDALLQLAVPLLNERVTLAAAVNLPTGISTYTDEEAQVAGIIAADLLPFRISNWGAGGSLDLSSQVAASTGGLNLGARVGYQIGQEFDLLEDGSFSYRPGNQLYVRLAADGNVGAAKAAAQVTVHTFADDQLNSQNLYRSGNRVQAMFSYSAPLSNGRVQAYAGALRRQHGTFLDGSEDTPAQTLLLLGAGLRRPMGQGVLVPSLDVRVLRSSDGQGQGYVGGAGVSYELNATTVTLTPSVRARFGSLLINDDVKSGISGLDAGVAIRFRGRN